MVRRGRGEVRMAVASRVNKAVASGLCLINAVFEAALPPMSDPNDGIDT